MKVVGGGAGGGVVELVELVELVAVDGWEVEVVDNWEEVGGVCWRHSIVLVVVLSIVVLAVVLAIGWLH